MKKLFLSLIATAIFTFAINNSLSAQEKSPAKKDTTQKKQMPPIPKPDPTIPIPDTPTKPVIPEKPSVPTDPKEPKVPEIPPPPLPKEPKTIAQ